MKLKKFNFKSIALMVLSIAAPLLNQKLQQVGVPVTIGNKFDIPMFGMIFISVNYAMAFPLIQAITTLMAGVTATGAFHFDKLFYTHWPTNIAGAIGSLFTVVAFFGLHATPTVQTAVAGLATTLIAYFSASPEDKPL